METKIVIDRHSPVSIHLQIKKQIEQLIYNNVLPEGKKLPPSRTLAKSLGVNRSTIVAVYDELISEDLLSAKVGSGTAVAQKPSSSASATSRSPMNWSEIFNITPRFEQDSLIKDTMAICAQPDMIMFAAGAPSPQSYPVGDFQQIMNQEFNAPHTGLFDLMPTGGYAPLMDLITQDTIREANSASCDEIMITSGSIQGLALISKTFVNADDLVVVENPTFFGALQSFNAAKARLLFVPTDQDGMQVDVLEKLLTRHRPKLIYTIPTFQNPGGTVMSLPRRRKLLDLAHRYSIPIVEDDPYSKIYFNEAPPPSLKALDRYNYVIYISTFSKMLFPGLRVGWLQASRPVIDRLTQAKLLLDLHTNAPGQILIHQYLAQGKLDGHLKKVRADYARRMAVMDGALNKFCSTLLKWQRPSGGYYFWCFLHDNLSSRELMLELFHDHVAILPGEAFYPGSEGSNWFRLNFTFPPIEQIEEGIERLGQALQRLRKKTRVIAKQEPLRGLPIV